MGLCIDSLSDEEVADLVQDLRECVLQIRSILRTAAPGPRQITNALRQASYNNRIITSKYYDGEQGDHHGPYANEDEFNDALRCGALPDITHRSGHSIAFTHGDLNMRNILVKDGKLSGIIDWETAGWYPEYWEYTKARYMKLDWRWLKMANEVFAKLGDYREELATERKLDS